MRVHSTGLRPGINPGRFLYRVGDFMRGSAIGKAPRQTWNRPEIDVLSAFRAIWRRC